MWNVYMELWMVDILKHLGKKHLVCSVITGFTCYHQPLVPFQAFQGVEVSTCSFTFEHEVFVVIHYGHHRLFEFVANKDEIIISLQVIQERFLVL